MLETSNLGLGLPDVNDAIDVRVFNENFQVLDEKIGVLQQDLQEKAPATGALPVGGAPGQYLTKKSDAHFDVEWAELDMEDGVIYLPIPTQFNAKEADWEDIPLPTEGDMVRYFTHARNNGIFALYWNDESTESSTICVQEQAQCDLDSLSIFFTYNQQNGDCRRFRYILTLRSNQVSRHLIEIPISAPELQGVLDTGNTVQGNAIILEDAGYSNCISSNGAEVENDLGDEKSVLTKLENGFLVQSYGFENNQMLRLGIQPDIDTETGDAMPDVAFSDGFKDAFFDALNIDDRIASSVNNLETLGLPQISDAVDSESSNIAASSNAVKTAYDEATAKVPRTGDTELSGTFAPEEDGIGSLGTAQQKWGTVHAVSFNGALNGNAETASKLADAKNIQTNLASTASAVFDGSADTALGVTGTLQPGNGGTGQTSLQATRNAMGLGNTTGVLPVANGGTGQATLALARSAMGLGNTTGALPVANGGTGGTTVTAAQANLGFAYSNASNAPTYLWATNSHGSNFLANRAAMSVGSAGNATMWNGAYRHWQGVGRMSYYYGSNDSTNTYVTYYDQFAWTQYHNTFASSNTFNAMASFQGGTGNRMQWGGTGLQGSDSSSYPCLQTTAGWRIRTWSNVNSYAPIAASSFNVGSSVKYKDNIAEEADDIVDKLLRIKPKTFQLKSDIEKHPNRAPVRHGVIAEEVYEIMPEIVVLDEATGDIDSVVYTDFIAPLIKAFQMQHAEIEYLKQQVQEIKTTQN